MRYTYLKLVNFASIFAAMKKRMIEIDLSKSKNKIVLLLGENGSGKTSIMSEMHVFAYPGTMDVRNGTDNILENEDGYKEIHFIRDHDEYIVKHFYMFKAKKGVKSFISKNGEELNKNGNQSSFKEIIELELGIEPDLMRLMRLGRNVTGVIDMKSSDRKSFMSDLFQDINGYLKMFKYASEKARTLRSLLRSVADKIDKLRIYDKNEETEKETKLKEELFLLKQELQDITGKIGRIDGSISSILPNGIDEFMIDLRSKQNEYNQLDRDLEKKGNKLRNIFVITTGDIKSEIEAIKEEIRENENMINVNKNMIDFYFNQLNSFYTEKEEKESNLRYISSETEYDNLIKLLKDVENKKEKQDVTFKNFNPKCTREELLRALNLMHEIDKLISMVQDYDYYAVREVCNLFLTGDIVNRVVKQRVEKIDDKLSKLNRQIMEQDQKLGIKTPDVYVLFTPPGCDCPCPYKKFYEDTKQKIEDSPRAKLEGEFKVLSNERETLVSYLDIAKTIEGILLLIKTNNDLAEKMPEKFFDVKNLLTAIHDYTPFYEEDHITDYISLMEDYESYVTLDQRINDIQREIDFIKKNSYTLTSLQKELEVIDVKIHDTEKEMQRLKEMNEGLLKRNENRQETLDDMEECDRIKSEMNDILQSMKSIKMELDKMDELKQSVDVFVIQRRNLEELQASTQRKIENVENEVLDIRFRLKEFDNLNREKLQLEEQFEEVNITRESLTTSKGIPLLFIQLYLADAKSTMNYLLEPVFNGSLEILDFIINENEFGIPYAKNGVVVSDASKCSDGERAFVSLALSFALIERSIKEYNVMLLDEVDSVLDHSKRAQFISIIEKQMEVIDAEQVFIITHNNMFDNYPVDVILTSNVDIENFKNVNIIYAA